MSIKIFSMLGFVLVFSFPLPEPFFIFFSHSQRIGYNYLLRGTGRASYVKQGVIAGVQAQTCLGLLPGPRNCKSRCFFPMSFFG